MSNYKKKRNLKISICLDFMNIQHNGGTNIDRYSKDLNLEM